MKKETRVVHLDTLCEECREKVTGKKKCPYCRKVRPIKELDPELWDRCKKCAAAWLDWQRRMSGRHGFDDLGRGASEAYARERFYRKEVESGVKGRDLIQPLMADGKPNPDFVSHYGTANFSKEQKEYIRDTMGNDPRDKQVEKGQKK